MKKWRKRLIPSTLTALLLVGIPFNSMSVTAYASSVGDSQILETTEATLSDQSDSVKETTSDASVTGKATTTDTTAETPETSAQSNPQTVEPNANNANTTTEPTKDVEPSKQPAKPMTYDEQRKSVIYAIREFEVNKTADNMKKVLEAFLQLPVLESYSNTTYRDDKYNFRDQIVENLKLITDENAKSELIVYFATESVKMVQKSKKLYDFGVADSAIKLLPQGELRTQLATTFQKLQNEVFGSVKDGYIDWLNPPDDLVVDNTPWTRPDNNVPMPDGSSDHMAPGGNSHQTPEQPNVSRPETYERSEIRYEMVGGKCYKVIKRYKNGSIAKEERSTPDKYEQIYCGASGNAGEGNNNPFPNAGVGSDYTRKPTEIVFDGYDPYNPDKRQEVYDQEKEQQTLEPITVQYTFDKASESPYYYDTGITIGEAKLLTYEQAKDALHQIAIQAKGEYVEDADQVLALINGKILVVKNEGKSIPFDTFAKKFNDTTVGVRALDTRTGEQLDLADLVEVKGVKSIVINKKDVALVAEPIVDNSIVLFPIEQIAKELGGNVTVEQSKITVRNEGHTLIFEEGKNAFNYDGKDVSIHVPIRRNKDGVMMAPIRALADAFDKSVEVDVHASKVIIE